MSRVLLAVCFLASRMGTLSAATLLTSCAKGTAEVGSVTSSNRAAQAEFRQIEEEWEIRGELSRAELRPRLEEYVENHADEPNAERARLMLSQIALSERRLGSAEEILSPLLNGSVGWARDEAQVILAALENRRGNPEKALRLLEPLHGKLLSREARDQYARERTNAALSTRRWRLAVSATISWLSESGMHSRAAKEWTTQSLNQIPTRALSRLLADWNKDLSSPSDQAASDWVHRLVIERLTDEALRTRDPLLARDLLQHAPPWLRAGEKGDELALLSALAQQEAKIAGRSVGIVVGGKSATQKRRSVRLALGLVRGLDLGLARGAPDGIQLLAVEERGSIETALGTLSGLGASILIAGVDNQGAIEALHFAESRKVPVVVMDDPRLNETLSFGFVFGVGLDAQKEAARLSQARAGKWGFVGEGKIPCSPFGQRPGVGNFPLSGLRQEGIDSILVLGDAACCRSVSQELQTLGWAPYVVWGLEGAHASLGFGSEPVRLAAGEFPQVGTEVLGAQLSEKERLIQRGQTPPPSPAGDWYFSLGHDAAKLVRTALSSLPETQATEKEEVKKLHERARQALLDARAELLTTQSKGFSSSLRMERHLRTVRWSEP